MVGFILQLKNMVRIFIIAVLLSMSANSVLAEQIPQALSEHTQVRFSIRYLKFWTVTGCFREIQGHIVTETGTGQLTEIKGDIKIESLQTGIGLRDIHLKSKSYFHQAEYPEMYFKSKSIAYVDKNSFSIEGLITIKGVSKPVLFTGRTDRFQLELDKGMRMEHLASGTIDREQFDIGPKGMLISRLVNFTISTVNCQDKQGNDMMCPEGIAVGSRNVECK